MLLCPSLPCFLYMYYSRADIARVQYDNHPVFVARTLGVHICVYVLCCVWCCILDCYAVCFEDVFLVVVLCRIVSYYTCCVVVLCVLHLSLRVCCIVLFLPCVVPVVVSWSCCCLMRDAVDVTAFSRTLLGCRGCTTIVVQAAILHAHTIFWLVAGFVVAAQQ